MSAVQMNDSGQAVTDLQQRLTDLGYYNGEITGFYGSLTQEAVMRFQQDMGLAADGVVGSATVTALYSPSGSSAQDPSTPRSLVRRGDSGSQISELQKRLAELGYYNASISGTFDQITEDAVTRFQRDNGLPADGIVGAATETALRQPAGQSFQTTNPAPSPTVFNSPTNSASNPTVSNLLRLGSTGASVSELQTRLTTLGLYQGAITGNYDAQTQAAVVALQRSRGLVPDGIAGPQVTAALGLPSVPGGNSTSGSISGSPTQSWQEIQQARTEAQQARILAEEAKREAEQARLEAEQSRLVLTQNLQEGRYSVAELQRYLRSNGYNPGDINGSLTPETRSAITEAQQRYGLSDTDLFGNILP
ncbi:MAG: peptidoglycan-binding protein [Drouetiella hepatica Uher 2000/2452]|uniref:Peptidoglycan-binding protein n=1 Tax=Drouetiella hepatica Uher 2000/2452 TaxID=904376 RepID=A0A951QDN0_9CYAN|nr:peptidoglycan-binding protein [Drouetiella hepatica Uher 2000/2452]